MNLKPDGVFLVVVAYLAGLLVTFTIMFGVLWAAAHFIRKFW